MFKSNKLIFSIVNRTAVSELLYKPNNNEYLFFTTGETFYSIEPSFTIFYKNNSRYNEGKYIVGRNEITDIRVRCDVSELSLDDITKEYHKKKYQRKANKTFHLNNDLLNFVSKLQAYISSNIIDIDFNEQDYTIDFTSMSDYVVVENSNKYSIDQISKVINTINDLDDLNLGRTIILNKTLTSFKNALTHVMNKSEHEISKVFKEYKEVLPLVLLGYDATLEFEYKIEEVGDGTTKPDIFLLDEQNERVTLVELKRADAIMFGGKYRVDTLRVKTEFSNAIHQTNIQRTKLSQSSKDYHYNIPKSILVYGNMENEKTNEVDIELVRTNLNILRYNNKDLIIMTYDEILERIDLILKDEK